MTRDEGRILLQGYLIKHPMSGRMLAHKIGVQDATVNNILRGGKGQVTTQVMSKILKFLKENDITAPRDTLSTLEICTLHNLVRAVGDDISSTIARLTDHLGLQEFGEIAPKHYDKALLFLKGLGNRDVI